MPTAKILNHAAVGMLQTLEWQKPCQILVMKLKESCDLAILGGGGGGILK
jgi:hypothetical protein